MVNPNDRNIDDVDYAEKMLLAKTLNHPEQRQKLKISGEHFRDTRHRNIYEKLTKESTTTAEDILSDSIREPNKYGDYQFVSNIIRFPAATKHGVINDQFQVYEFYKERTSQAAMKDYLENPTSTGANEVSQLIETLNKFTLDDTNRKIDVLSDIMDDLYGVNEQTLISTGFDNLDKIVSGFESQQLNIIAGRPSLGKTAFALGLAANLAKNGANVTFLSLETTEKNITQRLLSSMAKVDLYKFKKPTDRMTKDEVQKIIDTMDVYNKMTLEIEEHAKLTPNELRKIANKIPEDEQGFIFIDYLQLMYSDNKHTGKYEEVSNISREIKMIVQEMPNITIVALAQLNRGVEQRQDKRPMMSDLRDSGGIEQDANMIMMLYRDDYYNAPEDIDPNAPSPLEVMVVKNKDGGLGTAELVFYKQIQRIY